MTDHAHATIRRIAQRCARANLRLRDARALFEAIYRADALALEGGNITRAAKRAGVIRETFHRQRTRDETAIEEIDQ